MAKRPVTMAIREEDLVALDHLAGQHRVSRGDAVGLLLSGRLSIPKPSPDDDPDYIPPAPRLAKAAAVLAAVQAKVGVRPVVPEGDSLVSVGKGSENDWEDPP